MAGITPEAPSAAPASTAQPAPVVAPPAPADVVPNTPATLSTAGCDANPCFICWLRQRVKEAPSTQNVTFSDTPLQLNLMGLRLESSLSDQFDDALVVFFKLLEATKLAEFEKAVEQPLRENLEKVFAANPEQVKFIPCSKGLWVAAKFQISTEPGMAERRELLRRALTQQEQAIAKNKAGTDKLNEEFTAVKKRLPTAEQELATAKTNKDKKAITRLAKEVADLMGKQKSLPPRIATLEKQGTELEARRVTLETKFTAADKVNNDNPDLFELNEGTEGWYDEERAILPPRHYADAFTLFIHKTASAATFHKNTSMVALTTGYLDASRIFSVRRICAERVSTFLDKNRVVRQVRSVKGKDRLFHDDSVTLELKKNSAGVMEAYYKENGALTALAPEDQVLIKVPLGDKDIKVVGGTNLHRAHNVELLPDGTLQGSGSQWRVDGWSEGCQVFPNFDEFNLFIRLNAISKRWLCASKSARAGDTECALLEASDKDERGAGEQALVKRFGENFVQEAGDLSRGDKKTLRRIAELTERKRDFEWKTEDEEQLTQLEVAHKEAKGTLDKASLKRLEKLRTRKAQAFTQAQEDELKKLSSERDAWRREYLREKTKRLRADYMQVCDMAGTCKQRFSYTLVELTVTQWAELGTYFRQARNKAWDGNLVIGGKKTEPTAKSEPSSEPAPRAAGATTP